MLVLRRNTGEAIWISETIRVVVIDAGRGFCRLGIEAPREVNIRREELDPKKAKVD